MTCSTGSGHSRLVVQDRWAETPCPMSYQGCQKTSSPRPPKQGTRRLEKLRDETSTARLFPRLRRWRLQHFIIPPTFHTTSCKALGQQDCHPFSDATSHDR